MTDMDFKGNSFYLIGIKGTGMSNLAVILSRASATVSGCDVPTVFPTDAVLQANGIGFDEGFGEENLPQSVDYVIYSDAYRPQTCPVLRRALSCSGAGTVCSYPEFLAFLSENTVCYVVAGTHGKTTTTAASSWLLSRGKRAAFPFFSIFGSTVIGEGPVFQGTEELLLEGCEYRDHFLQYRVRGALITSIELDHPDYFSSEEAVKGSFRAFAEDICRGGFLILCTDSPNVKALARWVRENRRDLVLLEYGFEAKGPFRIRCDRGTGEYRTDLLPYRSFKLDAYSRPLVCDLFGAAFLSASILLDRPNPRLYFEGDEPVGDEIFSTLAGTMLRQLEQFPGVASRHQIIADEDGVVYIDDYAHHPTEIEACVGDLRGRFPGRKICLVFCPHTFSRTDALMEQFVRALSLADDVVIQKTYASARNETAGRDNAEDLAGQLEKVALSRPYGCLESAHYFQYDEDAAAFAARVLSQGGVCVSLGAGNDRRILDAVRECRRSLKQ